MIFKYSGRHEIDHYTIKLVVGLIAIFLAFYTNLFSTEQLTSISAAYYETDLSRNLFVGSLYAVAALVGAYNGRSTTEKMSSKLAALCALGVALIPCQCGRYSGEPDFLQNVHLIFASSLFIVLAFMCWLFKEHALHTAQARGWKEPLRRRWIYWGCLVGLMLAMLVIAIHITFRDGILDKFDPDLVYHGEALGLISFGVSWLTASHIFLLRFLSHSEERYSPFD
jgi:Na+-driven multidrug efflux pump